MKYFRTKEFECKCGQCRMPSEVQANIEALVTNTLDPLREAYGKPIYVNSGHRCEAYNRKVGGVSRSQHIVGEAADISLPLTAYGLQDELMKLAHILVHNGNYDQIILYPTFIHVSWKRNGGNRHKIMRKTATGYQLISLNA